MAPPVEEFPPSELTQKVQYTTSGKLRKKPIDLSKCKLMEMIQYNCHVREGNNKDPNATTVCDPVVRLFRR
ncbi:hypothetical protein K432DRAFT_386030 [Lepidopterella palustris CBS 459.81]|uniref:Uncharacterized protein n=1 Tax=Lepidopterella palustris CBS 459.81 TaxID=1314670 RepID=A0A8E2E1I4_9PEZI|nr:hypothetical protein K432DRAFT_386030 [Lepidopterella palustris CBS 459.81]